MSMASRTIRDGGFTLPEVLLASAILTFTVAALAQAIVAGQMQTYAALHDARAVALAETLLDEVLAMPYDDPDGASAAGPESGEVTRADFDNLDDYHGYTQSASAIVDPTDVAYPDEYQGFTRSVDVTYGTLSITDFGGDQSGLTVTVTVSEPGGRSWTLTRWVPEPLESTP